MRPVGHIAAQAGLDPRRRSPRRRRLHRRQLERPALQRLLANIQTGKIDVVVVYKVDRLTRSLLDLAKVVEWFTASGASFVSVTQNFSAADAMVRLTLNMLMSFAERTHDKIAAARRKGK